MQLKSQSKDLSASRQSVRDNLRNIRMVMPRQKGVSWKVMGSNLGDDKRFFSRKILKVRQYDHLVREIVHCILCASCIMN